VLEVLYYHAMFGGARISPAAEAVKNVEFFVCLSALSSFCERCAGGVRQVAPVVL